MISLDLLSKYLLMMEFGFDAMFYSDLGTKILMRAMTNVHTDRIWPAGSRFPTPALKYLICEKVS